MQSRKGFPPKDILRGRSNFWLSQPSQPSQRISLQAFSLWRQLFDIIAGRFFRIFRYRYYEDICVCVLESGRRINAASRRIFCSFSRFSFSYTVWGADPRVGTRRQWRLPPRLHQMDVGSKLIFISKEWSAEPETNGARHNTVLGKR